MREEKLENPLFTFVDSQKSRDVPPGKACFFGGLFFGAIMSVFFIVQSGLETGIGLALAVGLSTGMASGLLWGFFMYLFFFLFMKRIKKNNPTDLIASEPEGLGRILARIPSNHQQGSIAIGGIFLVGEKGFSFIPHRFNWFTKPKVLEVFWSEVQRVYKSSGGLRGGLFSGGIRDRLALEIGGEDHFFVVDQVDRIIEDLEKLAT